MSVCIYQGNIPVEGILCYYHVFVSPSIYHKRWEIMGYINSHVSIRNSPRKLYYCICPPPLKSTAFATTFSLLMFLKIRGQAYSLLQSACSLLSFTLHTDIQYVCTRAANIYLLRKQCIFHSSVSGISPRTNGFSGWSQRFAFSSNQEWESHKCQWRTFLVEFSGRQSPACQLTMNCGIRCSELTRLHKLGRWNTRWKYLA